MLEPIAAEPRRPSLLLVTSNGTGMGHVMRQLAVSRAVGDRADVVLLSLSSGLAAAASAGLRCEYLPSYQRPWIPRHEWDRYLSARLQALTAEVGADVVAFDGVAPYWGLMQARHALPHTRFVWFRRGMWRPGQNRSALRSGRFFDDIIEPGDLGDSRDRGPTRGLPALRVPPVSLIDVVTPYSREAAAHALGLDPSRRWALVTLGSGALGASDASAAAAASALTEAGYAVATTRAALATSDTPEGGTRLLDQVYPLVSYVRAFDLVVSAAGYNAVHEFVSAGLPTVLVPNTGTATDDQQARARGVADAGAAVLADPATGPDGVADAVREAVAGSDRLTGAALALAAQRGRGSAAAADALLALANHEGATSPSLGDRFAYAGSGAAEAAANLAQALLGRDRLRRWAHRPAEPPVPGRRLTVDLALDDTVAPAWPGTFAQASNGARPVLMTSRLDQGTTSGPDPVEHVLSGASPTYLAARVEIARRAYHVRSVTAAGPPDPP